ncbi:hypothetical protein FACS1894123_04580 [Bacteroidia bacterium]|nr:hypothetical protein FACS1894123_04580 [Bacteroidia bacterium]
MQLTAKLIQVLPLQTGNGRNGEWKKQDIIVETPGTYPKKVCVSIWGDKISPSQLQAGNNLNIEFDVESREFNGKWYTDVKAWKVDLADNRSNSATPPPPTPDDYGFPEPPALPAEDRNDLPF